MYRYKKEELLQNPIKLNNSVDYLDSSRYIKRNIPSLLPFRFINSNILLVENALFYIKFNSNSSNSFFEKNTFNSNYYVIKQKKYTKKNNSLNFYKKSDTRNIFLLNNKIFLEEKNNIFTNYKLIKKSKKHNDIIPLTLNKRLLRTKKTLTIPAHINLSIITSSFDIIHS